VAAVPLVVDERVTGVVFAVRTDAGAARDTRGAWLIIAAIAAAVITAAVLAAIVLGRRLAAPLERLAMVAGRLGQGDFSVRAPRSNDPEVDEVSSALDASAQRLRELIHRERAFTTNASHQLRTPLAALRLELEAIELDAHRGTEVRAALSQVDRLQTTIDTLLSVARDDASSTEDADLIQVLDGAELRWRAILASEARPLRYRSTARRSVARASPGVVDQIVDVLVENAQLHGSGAVTLTLRELDGWLAVDVADEGPGFDGDPERTMRVRPSRDGHGIGLGLARTLAVAQGGRLVVTSPGPGPVLTLMLRALPL
jgi:signal transduction histidine kinase